MAIILWADPDFPITPAHHEYWAALGRFIHRFAMMEQQFHRLLHLTALTTSEVSMALFSGTRAKQAISWIDRIIESRGEQPDKDWKRATDQFGVINGLRDEIVHQGALLYNEGFRVSNERRTIPRQHRVTAVSAEALEAMTADLQTIAATLFVIQVAAEGGDIAAYTTDWRKVGQTPWQYKSHPQAGAQDKQRGRDPKREGRRPPSRGSRKKEK